MAVPKLSKKGTWQIQIEVNGQRPSSTHATKREALAWAAAKTFELQTEGAGKTGTIKTLAEALQRYATEVSPGHRGWRWEIVRLAAYQKTGSALPIRKKLADLTTSDMADWRDARLAVVSKGTVLRDIGLLSAVFEAARLEWGWLKTNPLTNLRKPSSPPHREMLVSGLQVRQMLRSLGHTRKAPRTVSQAVAYCFLTALATGMRAGELCGLTWEHVHPTHVVLPITKNGKRRDVPLSAVAVRLIQRVRGFDVDKVFGLQTQSLDALFRRARNRANLEGFTFHDSRHTAATRMSSKVDVLTLCKIFGWSNTTQALTYYNPKASDIAKRI